MLLTSWFRDRPAFGFQHRAQLPDAAVERDALVVDLGAEDLAVVLDTQLESNEPLDRARTLAADDLAVAFVTRQSVRSLSPRWTYGRRGPRRTTPTSDLLASEPPSRDDYRRFKIILSTTNPTVTAPNTHHAVGGCLWL